MSLVSIPLPSPLVDNINMLGSPITEARMALRRYPALHDIPGVEDDLLHSFSFLQSYNGSTATFNSYRREVERLLQWTCFVRGCGLADLGRQDMEDFVHFCQSPPQTWIARHQSPRFVSRNGLRIANPDWRPFIGEESGNVLIADLSQKSLQSLFSVLSTYFNYLLQEDYLRINPVTLIRQKSKFLQKHAYQAPVRRISNLQWDFILDTVNQMAAENPAEHERSLFVMHCLFGMYLRISELVADERSTPVMGDFQNDSDGNWWLKVTGKGNKVRMVTVSDDMLASLVRYRQHLGLGKLPYPGEQTPLVPRVRGRGPVTSTRQIRYLVQFCFDRAFDRMRNEGLEDEAQELRVATVHWLRHTGISEDVKFRPKEHVKEDAGHASMATTDRYIDTEMRERHASARNKKLKPEL
jgi:site-specific recombinase XerD